MSKYFRRSGSSFRGDSRNSYNRGGSKSFNSYGRSNFRRSGSKPRYDKGESIDVNRFVFKAKDIDTSESYNPNNTFATFNLSAQLLTNILSKGYTSPTPIQDEAIKPIMEGRDLIGLANTGTGKTAAFLIPMIEKVFKDNSQSVFIVVPTRELAVQINEELRAFSQGMRIYSALLIGGANIQRQIHELRRNPHFVIGTPGRIKDVIERRVLNLANFQNIVLDEVDLMVDIGFIKDVQYFISLLSKERQSLFFSATISGKVHSLLQSFVKNPVTVSVKKQDTAEFVDQDVIRVSDKSKKIETLHDLLIKEGFDKVLIFGRTKWSVEDLSKTLISRGFKAGAIHGNKSQGHRQRMVRAFKESEIKILLATDVASRGLDIPDVSHVINYDIPETYDDYIHRIGRTGRAGKIGTALTFI